MTLDEALEKLYAVPPDQFMAKRKALAKDADDAETARAIAKQRKPTLVAYVLNQLARTHADEVAALVDMGRELGRAQRRALRGEASGELRGAIAKQREAVALLVKQTAALMNDIGVAVGHLDEVSSAFHAALVDPVFAAALEAGRLDRAPDPATGFLGIGAEASELPRPPSKGRRDRRPKKPTKKPTAAIDRRAKARAEKAERAAAEKAAKEAARAEAKRAKAEARTAADTAKDAAAALVAEAKRLRAEADAAERAAKKAIAHAKALAAKVRHAGIVRA